MPLFKAHDLRELPIPQGLIGWWFGTAATIPYGWEGANGSVAVNDPSFTRPNLVNYFTKGCASSGEAPGAHVAATPHAHTMPAHGHATGANIERQWVNQGFDGYCTDDGHTHTLPSAGPFSTGSSAPKPAAIYGVPIVYTLKGQSPTGPRVHDFKTDALPPMKIIGAWGHSASAPTGWSKCDGGTVNGVVAPNFLGKYIRGIPNTATNPGTTGGSNTHTHNLSHWHDTAYGGNTNSGYGDINYNWYASASHHHHSNSQCGTSDAQNNEPNYVTTHYICFTGHGSGVAAHAAASLPASQLDASTRFPRGVVLIWGHPVSEKPSGWSHCDGGAWTAPTGYGANRPSLLGTFIEGTGGDGGGSNGASDSHAHSGGSAETHAHGTSSTYNSSSSGHEPGSGVGGYDHSHPGTTSVNFDAPSGSNVPYYQEVAFIVRD